jgi:predicted AlkP superfamily pyrophosphatase or phosphodiesterase
MEAFVTCSMPTSRRQFLRRSLTFAGACAIPSALTAAVALRSPVLLISIDGMRPDCVTRADQHGLVIPNLRRFISEGTYASGVIGVLPTITYPAHTTMLTGVWPAEHGIYNNARFTLLPHLTGGRTAAEIRVPSLWDAAHAAGIRTASVGWPASKGALSVDFLIPDGSAETMRALSRPANLMNDLGVRENASENSSIVEFDRIWMDNALAMLKQERPGFMTVHITSLDSMQHETGLFTPESIKTLEAIDGMVGDLICAALESDPKSRVIIVSDHGFADVSIAVNLFVPFVKAGLMKISTSSSDSTVTITDWQAAPWIAGGMAAVMLRDSQDAKLRNSVRTVLDGVSKDWANGVEAILEGDEIERRGGFPDASFLVLFRPGFQMGPAYTGPLLNASVEKGQHGYAPEHPEMNSSFFVKGAGIAKGRDLGLIDMRQIAPTVAGLLGVRVREAKQPIVNVRP